MRKLMWFAIGFAIACGVCLWVLPEGWTGPLALLAGGASAALLFLRKPRAATACIGCCLGLVWYLFFQWYYLLPAHAMDGIPVETTVTSMNYSYDTQYGVAVDGTMELDGKTYMARIYISQSGQIRPGDEITGTFLLRYTAPGGMKDPTYHAGERILFLGYQRGEVAIVQGVKQSLRQYAAELAYEISGKLDALFPADVSAFVKAVLLGDDSQLSYEADTDLQISGIRHIVAVSGLHVAVLYTMLQVLTWNRRYLTALIGIPALAVFSAVAGFTPSVTRACIMVGLMMLAQVANREYDPPTALSFSALVMLIWNPLIMLSVSFQMSVACVAGILLFQNSISDYLSEKLGKPKGKSFAARLKRGFISSVSITLSATSLTVPMAAYHFGTVSLIGIVTNLLTLWAVQWIFIGAAACLIIGMMSFRLAAALGWCIAWLVRYVMGIAGALADFSLAAVYTQSVYIVIWLAGVYILLAVFLLSRRKHPGMIVCCAAAGLCVALLFSWIEPLTAGTHWTVLDVGQGQSIILQSGGKVFLIDCGGSNDEIAADTAAETLLSRGITHLDGIFLTHGDRDHAGGIPYLLTRIGSDFLMVPSTTEEDVLASIASGYEGQIIPVEDDLHLTFENGCIRVFCPIFAGDRNENSLCILFESENCDILITGDRNWIGELWLLKQRELPDVDVLVAGHHGSKNATSQALLEAVRPEVVIISAGKGNAYGHPAPETLARLEQFGCQVWRTDLQGTIIFRR